MNIILGQGNAIKEVHNVKKQNLEMNQHFVAQQTDDLKKEDKSKVQEFETNNRIEIKKDKERKKDHKKRKKNKDAEEEEDTLNLPEGSVIDIRV
jgi:alpha-galactosidase/6-phospho-beta-glucosidase family protein